MSAVIDPFGTADEKGIFKSVFPRFFPFNGSDGPDYMNGWDLCILGGDKLPGIAEISGPGIRLRKDPNAKAGSNGGKPVYHGLEEQEPKIKIIVWTQRHLDILWSLRTKIIPLAGTTPKNISIDSPWVKLIGVTSIAIVGATGLMPHSSARVAKGLEMTLSASHWLGDSKGAGKNVTVQPIRSVRNSRPLPDTPSPTSTPGVCGPPVSRG